MLDLKRLSKLMMLTTSESDGEALVALRKASAMLTQEDMTWEDIVSAPKEKTRLVPQEIVRKQLNELLDLISEEGLTESTAQFVKSLANQFSKRGYLTPKQRTVLDNIHQAHC